MSLICNDCHKPYAQYGESPRGKCHPCYLVYQINHRNKSNEFSVYKARWIKELSRQIWGAKFHERTPA